MSANDLLIPDFRFGIILLALLSAGLLEVIYQEKGGNL
jgi:uncharacterized membrane protein